MGTELESKLAVVSDQPEAVLERLLALESTANGRPLRVDGEKRLRDTYLDDSAGSLRAVGFALRVREVEGQPRRKLTLKGPAVREGEHGVRRLEIEGPLGPATLGEVHAALEAVGVPLTGELQGDEDAEGVARALKLVLVQSRRTWRRRRIALGEDDQPLAEIAFDRVGYELEGGVVTHCEVEVEALGGATSALVDGITSALLEADPPSLRPWRLDKSAFGAELQRRARAGLAIADEGGHVLRGVYDELLRER